MNTCGKCVLFWDCFKHTEIEAEDLPCENFIAHPLAEAEESKSKLDASERRE